MKDTESEIDRVLAALGGVEAPEEMERRMVVALREASTARRERVRWFGVWGIAGAAGVMAVVVLCWTGLRGGGVRERAPVQEISRSAPTVQGSVPSVTPARSRESAETRSRARARRVRGDRTMKATQGDYPAPEMPLTSEELLLQRMARHRPTEQLAMLDPEMQAALEEQETAEFQRFLRTTTYRR